MILSFSSVFFCAGIVSAYGANHQPDAYKVLVIFYVIYYFLYILYVYPYRMGCFESPMDILNTSALLFLKPPSTRIEPQVLTRNTAHALRHADYLLFVSNLPKGYKRHHLATPPTGPRSKQKRK